MGKIALTGSSGLVGTAVIDYLINHTTHDLVLIDARPPAAPIESPRLRYVTLDLKDPEVWLFR